MATVLIVDDDKVSRLIAKRVISQSAGYTVTLYESGEELLENFTDQNPDIVLLDIEMPGIDGYEACKRIKEMPESKYVSVIMLSKKGAVEDKITAGMYGANAYIVKPFQPSEVLNVLRLELRVIELRKKIDSLQTKLDQK